MKIMKKLLAGALCALSLAMPVCAANGDNDQNGALNNAAVVANDERRDVQSELHRMLRRAKTSYAWIEEHPQIEIFIDTVSNLIRNGAEIDDRILDDNDNILCSIVFNNPNFNQFPDDVRNHILGKALLYFVKNQYRYAVQYGRNHDLLKFNYQTIKALWELHPPIDFTDDQGLTALQIVENRYNTWRNGEIPDDVMVFFIDGQSGITDLQGRQSRNIFDHSLLVTLDNVNIEKVRNQECRKVKKHDEKVFRLLTMSARRNQDNNCCTIC